MTANEALDIIQNEFAFRDVTDCKEFPDKFIFSVVTDPDKTDYSDPFYAVDKESGKVSGYNPMFDLENFSKAKSIDI